MKLLKTLLIVLAFITLSSFVRSEETETTGISNDDFIIEIGGKNVCWGLLKYKSYKDTKDPLRSIGIVIENCKTGNSDLMSKYVYKKDKNCIIPYRYLNNNKALTHDPFMDRKYIKTRISSEKGKEEDLRVLFEYYRIGTGISYSYVKSLKTYIVENTNKMIQSVNDSRNKFNKCISKVDALTTQINSGAVSLKTIKEAYSKKKEEVDVKFQENSKGLKSIQEKISAIENQTSSIENEIDSIRAKIVALNADINRNQEEEKATPLSSEQLKSRVSSLGQLFEKSSSALLGSLKLFKTEFTQTFKGPLVSETKKKIDSFNNPFTTSKN